MLKRCASQNVSVFPSIGPGYLDTAVRPWNGEQSQDRNRGAFMLKKFLRALHATRHLQQSIAAPSSSFMGGISVTSFNEWHEGTQIEPAQTLSQSALTEAQSVGRDLPYNSYAPDSPEFYLRLLRHLVDMWDEVLVYKNVTLAPDEANT